MADVYSGTEWDRVLRNVVKDALELSRRQQEREEYQRSICYKKRFVVINNKLYLERYDVAGGTGCPT